ncbi:MAG: protein kinase [Planctomycetaceae bacterium]|nr:protein kinase [Planctomycetaceae bacterium]
MIDRPEAHAADAAHDDPPAQYVEIVAGFDEDLRRGEVPSTAVSPAAETQGGQQALFQCLQLLERAWPRHIDAATPAQPQQIGKFRIERIVGQGGFGIVYLAHDTILGRTVALKVPRLHTLTSRSLLERFHREARAAAALDHPHIVPLYEAGENNGLCYIASAYCPGLNLAQWLREHSSGVAPLVAARLAARLADAVGYSHAHGVLHRDIKPGNVLLFPRRPEDAGEGPDSQPGLPFVPRLADFGLAKLYQDAAFEHGVRDETAGTAMLGTPAYMAPEQMERAGAGVGPGADVYSLGVVLYELLVGRPPFQGPNVLDVLDQVRSSDPVPVRRLRRDVPRDLETICLQCLAKSAVRRYATANELRDDLQRFLDGRPIHARPPGRLDIAAKWIRRRPAAAALIATVTVAMLAVAGLQTWHAARLETANKELETALQQVTAENARAIASEHEARGIAYALDIQSAWRARHAGDFIEFSRIIDRYRDDTPLTQYRGNEWHYLERFTRTEQRTLLNSPTPVYDIVFGLQNQAAVVGEDAVVRLLDLRTGQLTAAWPSGQIEVNSACFMPDGKSLWTAGDDGTVRCWDVATQAELQRIDAHAPAKVFKVRYAAESGLLLTCGTDGPIRLWDLAKGGVSAGALEGHTDWVQDILLIGDSNRVVSASDDYSVRLWDLESRTEIWREHRDRWKVRDITLSPDERHIAACTDRLRIYDLQSLSLTLELIVLDEARMVGFSGDGERLYVADRQGIVHVFDCGRDESGRIVEAEVLGQWRAHESGIYSLRSSPLDQTILTAGKDGQVKQWHAVGGTPEPRTITLPGLVQSLAFDPQGRWLAAGGNFGVELRDYQDQEQPPVMLTRHGNWTTLAVSPDGTSVVAGANTGEIRAWNTLDLQSRVLRAGQPVADPDNAATGRQIEALSFSRDGQVLAVAPQGTHVLLLDARTGDERQRIETNRATTCRLSPTEDVLAVTTADHRIELWDWPAARRIWQSDRYAERPKLVSFSPDGQLVLAETGDRTARIFDRSSGNILRELGQHRGGILCIEMSGDGRTIATKDNLGQVNFWHAASGQLLYSLPVESLVGFEDVDFSPDGKWLAFRSDWETVQLVPMHP